MQSTRVSRWKYANSSPNPRFGLTVQKGLAGSDVLILGLVLSFQNGVLLSVVPIKRVDSVHIKQETKSSKTKSDVCLLLRMYISFDTAVTPEHETQLSFAIPRSQSDRFQQTTFLFLCYEVTTRYHLQVSSSSLICIPSFYMKLSVGSKCEFRRTKGGARASKKIRKKNWKNISKNTEDFYKSPTLCNTCEGSGASLHFKKIFKEKKKHRRSTYLRLQWSNGVSLGNSAGLVHASASVLHYGQHSNCKYTHIRSREYLSQHFSALSLSFCQDPKFLWSWVSILNIFAKHLYKPIWYLLRHTPLELSKNITVGIMSRSPNVQVRYRIARIILCIIF